MERKILIGDEAKSFYTEATKEGKFTEFGKEFAGIGGYFQSEYPSITIAFDFTNGHEVFTEEFDDEGEAVKYASGVEARTKDDLLI